VPTVRRAEPRDADVVLGLLADLGRPLAADDPDPQRQVFLDYLAFDDAAVFVVEDEGDVVGIASLWIRPRLNRTVPEGWLAELYVDPARRRRGAARHLLDVCVREARRRGCHRLVLESAVHRDDAHAFYEAYGFRHTARRYELGLD
jgi:ribosomal protein S18 acetylase RimI-like enzyme